MTTEISTQQVRAALAKNRAEELGRDVYKQFVIPPFIHRLDMEASRKPKVIEGGRGSGKTMLLRYFSHATTFSIHRQHIGDSELGHIGLYWKADTQFARWMTARGHDDATWSAAFEHLLALVISTELLGSLRSIARSSCEALVDSQLSRVSFDDLSVYDESIAGSIEDVERAVGKLSRGFERWSNNAERLQSPVFLPGLRFVRALIEVVLTAVPTLGAANFMVYIDEYENLLPYQQRIVNTYIKHSESPLVINIAVKRNAMKVADTTGSEALVDIADYRKHNIEDYLEPDFAVFAAEILLLQLTQAGIATPIDEARLRDPAAIEQRRGSSYRERVLAFARTLFPGVSHQELAEMALADRAIRGVLRERIERALKLRGAPVSVDQFVRPAYPQATVTCVALLSRPSMSIIEVLNELEKLESGAENRFTGKTSWIHNNFIGALLPLYEPYGKVCPFFAGFDSFCSIAKVNLRHFLEICHRALSRAGSSALEQGRVELQEQAEAARDASAAFLSQVRSFGTHGDQLYAFVLRIGSLFALAHKRPTQSEPEISSFSLRGPDRAHTTSQQSFLDEAEKWSVISREIETKIKPTVAERSFEYVLNPIYSVYFNITYRKRRKIEITLAEFETLVDGTYDEFTELLRSYQRKWDVDQRDLMPSLFSHLNG